MVQRPVRRDYSERSKYKIRDVDAAFRGRFLQAFGWLAMAGLFWGGLIGGLMGGFPGAVLGGLGGILLLGVGGGGAVTLFTERMGGTARVLYNPSGSSTPRQRDYSYAKSLAARGAYREAIQAYEEALAEEPLNPAPYLAISRILRDDLEEYQQAARWLRRTRREAELDRGQEILVARELVELYRHRVGEPRKAAPELARLAESFPDTREGEWAARELRELKESMKEGTANREGNANQAGTAKQEETP